MLGRFGDSGAYRSYVDELVARGEYPSPLKGTWGSTLLGTESFVEEVVGTHLSGRRLERDLPAVRELVKARTIERIVFEVGHAFDDVRIATKVGIYLAHRHSGATLRDLGSYFAKKESAISQTSRRLASAIINDRKLAESVRDIENRLSLSPS